MKPSTSSTALLSILVGLLVSIAGCGDANEPPAAENPALAAPVPAGMVRGTVLETMNAGGYTYVLVDTGQDQRWAATQQTVVQVGDVVQMSEGMAMTGFTSKSLNRTFDIVYFIDGLQNLSAAPGQAAALPEGHPATALPPGHPTTPAQAAAAETALTDVAVNALEEGRDIAWVHANRDTLAGQSVSLRGTVVKYNEGILGWNFIHLQDGSGDAAAGSNDLTVTSKAQAAVGQTVVVTGTVILDKDFGAGYTFPVMIEDASVTTE